MGRLTKTDHGIVLCANRTDRCTSERCGFCRHNMAVFNLLAAYENTGMTPAECAQARGLIGRELASIVDSICTVEGTSIPRLRELGKADRERRLWEAPCKMGTTLYMIVTKRPKLNWPEFSFIKTTELTEHNFFRVIRDFGKTVFLYRQDAEDALAKIKEA